MTAAPCGIPSRHEFNARLPVEPLKEDPADDPLAPFLQPDTRRKW